MCSWALMVVQWGEVRLGKILNAWTGGELTTFEFTKAAAVGTAMALARYRWPAGA